MSALLEVIGLNKSFGSVVAASNIEVEVDASEVVGIIGANGAGKTTFVNLVTGYLQPTSGTIAFEGRDITALAPRDIIAAGISRSFQVPQVFATASVRDNLLIACGLASGGRFPLWRPLRRPEMVAEADRLVDTFRIGDYRDQPAALLPQGVRKLLDIAMALVRQPRLLLLDEPTSGISAEEKFAIMDLIMAALAEERIAVMFIEHDMDIIARYAGRVLAFIDGTIAARGSPDAVLADPLVRRSITGEHAPARAPGNGAAP
jgi:branched-chain amino acid transport system ATP-binding protein